MSDKAMPIRIFEYRRSRLIDPNSAGIRFSKFNFGLSREARRTDLCKGCLNWKEKIITVELRSVADRMDKKLY